MPLTPKSLLIAGWMSATALVAMAQPFETATVLSVTPVLTQVPHQVCTSSPQIVSEPKSGAGAVLGALAGGVVGNALGQGACNATASAIGVIVQIARMSDGTRKVTNISEVTGMDLDVISTQEIFVFEKLGLNQDGKVVGRFRATGVRPKVSERLLAAGIPVVETWDLTPTPIDMLVGFSHEHIGEDLCRYLHTRGYRRPALRNRDAGSAPAREQRRARNEVVEQHGDDLRLQSAP